MKTKGILTALIIVVFTSVNLIVNAQTQKENTLPDQNLHRINIRVNQNNQVVLRSACLENKDYSKLILKVFSQEGELMFASTIREKGGIYKGFDINNLPDGQYAFEVYKNLKMVYSKNVYKSHEIVSSDQNTSRMIVQEL